MKEVEKNEIKRLSDRLDAIRHQQAGLSLVESAEKYAELEKEKRRSKLKSNVCVASTARNSVKKHKSW
jgi:ribosome-associated protein